MMKEYNLIVPEQVYRDIDEIVYYMNSMRAYQSTIDKLIQEIDENLERLKISPKIGPDLQPRVPVPTTFRYLVVQDYLIFYDVVAEDVKVIRILSGKKNWQAVLFND